MSKELANTEVHDRMAEQIVLLIENAKHHIIAEVNSTMTVTYYEIGRLIVEHEQKGQKRAGYGEKLIPELARRLTERFGKGFSKRNLANMRQSYLVYSPIFQTPTGILQTVSAKFPLSWSHYLFLMGINNPQERKFYETEATNERWSLREMKRQFNSALYERLVLSRDKKAVAEMSQKGQIVERPEDIVKDPYILEFLGLKEDSRYSESDLEQRIID
ncbi:MAG: hypothetical protein IIZ54_03080, partial [Selenomonadaceae bacterium]|nr:hypothetical protein [Selenomonadaceae bacterium]